MHSFDAHFSWANVLRSGQSVINPRSIRRRNQMKYQAINFGAKLKLFDEQ